MENRQLRIGIFGPAGSGKDYLCSVLQYFFERDFSLESFDKTLVEALYKDFREVSHFYNINTKWIKSVRLAFGDFMKNGLSAILGIPLEILHDSKKKDSYYINLSTFKLYEELPEDGIAVSDKEFFNFMNERTILKTEYSAELPIMLEDDYEERRLYMTVRNAMTWFGTYVCRNFIHNQIWVNSLLNSKEFSQDKPIVVTDIRFVNELEALQEKDFIIVKVDNPNNEKTVSNIAESHYLEFSYDLEFHNDSKSPENTLEGLYELLEKMQEIFKSKSK